MVSKNPPSGLCRDKEPTQKRLYPQLSMNGLELMWDANTNCADKKLAKVVPLSYISFKAKLNKNSVHWKIPLQMNGKFWALGLTGRFATLSGFTLRTSKEAFHSLETAKALREYEGFKKALEKALWRRSSPFFNLTLVAVAEGEKENHRDRRQTQ